MVTKRYAVFRLEGVNLCSSPRENHIKNKLYDYLYESEVDASMGIEGLGEHGERYVILPTFIKQG